MTRLCGRRQLLNGGWWWCDGRWEERERSKKIQRSVCLTAEISTDRQYVEIKIEEAMDRKSFEIFTELVCLPNFVQAEGDLDGKTFPRICIEAATDRQFIEISIELVCLTILHYHRVSNIMRFAITMAAADATTNGMATKP